MLPTYLVDSIILLTAAVVLVPLMQYLRLGSIIGFLAAGIVVGPWVLSLISEVEEIRHFAELPIFTNGIEAGLLVMGTVARIGIPGFFMGNTAEAIYSNISCSTLALKPPGFATPVTLED